VCHATFTVILNSFQDPPESDLRKSSRVAISYVPILVRTYSLAYHLRLRDAKERLSSGEPTGACHRQIYNGRVIYRFFAFGVTVPAYSHTQEIAPTGARFFYLCNSQVMMIW
jgi:hypothetical protein